MTNTFRVAGATTWQLAVDGKDFSRVGIQTTSSIPVQVCIGTEKPAESSTDYMVLSSTGTREIVTTLAAADKVYIRAAQNLRTAIRGFREGR